ncbi:MAG: PEP-CTERM-box response regulator transcription factor [Thiotrichales bacterium]|nr:PEP-CTERM-box response regulator transcription factor [Thiotrichales bacterium]
MSIDGQLNNVKILIIDDDPGMQKQLKWCFSEMDVEVTDNRKQAIKLAEKQQPPVVILDLGLPPDATNASEGLKLLEELIQLNSNLKIIVVTGNDDRGNALKAIDLGAYDFYQKPVDSDVLRLIVSRAYQLYLIEDENRQLHLANDNTALTGFVSANPAMKVICQKIEKIAPSDITVLLLGESGTGKELLARSLYELGLKKDGPFIAINCAAIPENLLESELFGYEKGAFTGAAKQTLGKIELANGGVLFLDEIGDLPLALQAKILRFLQERVIERVGGRQEIPVDLRVVCATHQDLKAKIGDGGFREDLYYRLSEITIEIPPLRERTGDAVLLAQYFLNQMQQDETKRKKLHEGAIRAIESHSWPGNARELENRIKRGLILSDADYITATDLELTNSGESTDDDGSLNLKFVRQQAEYNAILQALGRCDGNLSQAAKLLGVSRPTVYDLIQRYEIDV